MTAWQIKDWGKERSEGGRLFEVSQSSRYKSPAWVPWPINLDGEHYRILVAHPDGQRAYGLFAVLVALAAVQPCKGLLFDVKGPLTIGKMSAQTGVPKPDLEWAIQFLSAEEIGWLEEISDRTARERVRRSLSERARSKRGDISAPEQAAEQEQALELEQESAAKQSLPRGLVLAAAAPPDCKDVYEVLSKLWTKGTKALELSRHPNASFERVCWLAERIRREKPDRPHGFMEDGIKAPYNPPAEWLAKWRSVMGVA